MNLALEVTVAIFLAGIIFAAGRLTSRVESLEDWRGEVKGDLHRIRDGIDRLLKMPPEGGQ